MQLHIHIYDIQTERNRERGRGQHQHQHNSKYIHIFMHIHMCAQIQQKIGGFLCQLQEFQVFKNSQHALSQSFCLVLLHFHRIHRIFVKNFFRCCCFFITPKCTFPDRCLMKKAACSFSFMDVKTFS